MHRRPAFLAALPAIGAVLVIGGFLTGCAPTQHLEPAPAANDPKCADVIVRLPDAILTLQQRETDAQSTAAWGDPTSVILRCGVKVPIVSSLPCVNPESVFWLRDDSDKAFWTFTTYGRDPAIAVSISKTDKAVSPGQVLDTLDGQIAFLPKNGHECQSLQDTVTGESLPPSDAPTPVPTP